jgi:hypothetical protein
MGAFYGMLCSTLRTTCDVFKKLVSHSRMCIKCSHTALNSAGREITRVEYSNKRREIRKGETRAKPPVKEVGEEKLEEVSTLLLSVVCFVVPLFELKRIMSSPYPRHTNSANCRMRMRWR